MKTFQSRFGHHPCDHETYLKLKRLYKYHWQNVYDHARWTRWSRKEPQNQVIRKRPAKGLPLTVIGPWPEPSYCAPLLRKDIVEAFQQARTPILNPEDVKPMSLSVKEIDSLLSLLDCWLNRPAA